MRGNFLERSKCSFINLEIVSCKGLCIWSIPKFSLVFISALLKYRKETSSLWKVWKTCIFDSLSLQHQTLKQNCGKEAILSHAKLGANVTNGIRPFFDDEIAFLKFSIRIVRHILSQLACIERKKTCFGTVQRSNYNLNSWT